MGDLEDTPLPDEEFIWHFTGVLGENDLDTARELIADGRTAEELHACLSEASASGNVPFVALLLEAGAPADPLTLSWEISAPLTEAAHGGHYEVAELLIAAGASVEYEEGGALELAARGGHLRVVELFLRSGAVVLDEALDAAVEGEHVDVVSCFLRAGVWSKYAESFVRSHRGLLLSVPKDVVPVLPADLQRSWGRLHLRPKLRLFSLLARVRSRLDRPPTSPLGKARPTRAELTEHLRTAGRRFAREYWKEGIPLFFPACAEELGEVPREFM